MVPPLRYYPIFLALEGRRVLVLGDGEVAERKAEPLAAAGATILHRSRFDAADLDGCALAIGADAPEPELVALAAAAAARGIPVNIVDRPELCGFLSPAVIDRAPVTVAIGTGGAAPVLARILRQRIEALLPPALGRLAALADRSTAALRTRHPDPARRRPLLEAAFTGPALDLLSSGREAEAEAAFAAALAGDPPRGVVHRIAAPAEPDLLTLRAHRLLGQADTVLHDPEVPQSVLAMARRDARRECAGADAETRAAQAASAGQTVVRLYWATQPPSIDNGAPVMVDAASEHRNTASAPI